MIDTIPTLVIGAGYVGTALALRMHAKQQRVVPWVASQRSQQTLAKLGLNAQRIDLDANTPMPQNMIDNTNVVYLVPPARTSLTDSRLAKFLRLAPAKITQFIYVSTSGVYGDRQGAVCTEESVPAPATDRAKRRLNAESQIMEFCQARKIPWLILRVPGIYGPGRLPIAAINAQKPIIQLAEAAPGNRIHRDDLAHIIACSLETTEMQGVVNVSDGNTMSSSEFTLLVARLADLSPPPQISREQMHKTASASRLSFLNESRILDISKLRAGLKKPLCYANPLDGIRHSLAQA